MDGRGGLLTTTRCLLSPLRNPDLGCQALEALFAELFGIERTMWLENGHLAGDDTDSHIDTLARFCNPTTIAYVSCDDPHDQHFHELKEMQAELRCLRDADGRPYNLVPLPWPEPQHDSSGERLPATYANFLIINGAVLVPLYGAPRDEQALAVLADCFPDRQIIGIDCLPLIRQYGSLHCATMQIPADDKLRPESASSSGRIAQALDPSSYMKNLTRPEGMAAIFHYAIRINILHSTLPLNPRIQVRDSP